MSACSTRPSRIVSVARAAVKSPWHPVGCNASADETVGGTSRSGSDSRGFLLTSSARTCYGSAGGAHVDTNSRSARFAWRTRSAPVLEQERQGRVGRCSCPSDRAPRESGRPGTRCSATCGVDHMSSRSSRSAAESVASQRGSDGALDRSDQVDGDQSTWSHQAPVTTRCSYRSARPDPGSPSSAITGERLGGVALLPVRGLVPQRPHREPPTAAGRGAGARRSAGGRPPDAAGS